MKRRIIHIDEAKCNGCGACAEACHEGAIQMINGKAKLTREDYCDGLGDCLPGCPTGAITFPQPCAGGHGGQLPRLSPEEDKRASVCRSCGAYTQPAAPVAGADQAGPGKRPLV